jgi:hypothetical protein
VITARGIESPWAIRRDIVRGLRVLSIALVLALVLTSGAFAGPGGKDKKGGRPVKVKIHKKGEVFCPAAAMVVGAVIVRPGRCYVVAIVRDRRGSFLAFLPRDAKIPPGQLVRLNTRAGAKIKAKIVYLVPVHTVAAVPVDGLSLVGLRVEDTGPKMSLTILGLPSAGVTVVFNIRV